MHNQEAHDINEKVTKDGPYMVWQGLVLGDVWGGGGSGLGGVGLVAAHTGVLPGAVLHHHLPARVAQYRHEAVDVVQQVGLHSGGDGKVCT